MASSNFPFDLANGVESHLKYLDEATVKEVEEMMDGDSELVIDLIDTLLETTPELLEELTAGVKQNNANQIREAAHALKSSTAQMGAFVFSDLCKKIEEKAKSNQLQGVQELFQALIKEDVRLKKALESWKDSLL